MIIDAAIIGTHKSGSTSLFYMLKQNEQIHTHFGNQFPNIFVNEDFHLDFDKIYKKHVGEFDKSNKVLIRDHSLFINHEALARLKTKAPSAKLIIVLREPIERAYSAFCYAQSTGHELEGDFDKVINEQEKTPWDSNRPDVCNYLSMGFYFSILQKIEKIYPREQLILLTSSDLRNNATTTCKKVFDGLGLEGIEIQPIFKNKTQQVKTKKVEQFLKKDNFLKTLFKTLVPIKMRMKVREFITRMNKQETKYPGMTVAQKLKLQKIFEEENKLLKEHYNIDFYK